MAEKTIYQSKSATLIVSLLLLFTPFSTAVFATDTFTYDANGNMIRDTASGRCYEYNDINLVKKVTNCQGSTLAEYWYDYSGRRVKKVESGITTYYPFPDYEERVYPDGHHEISEYVIANGEIVARIDTDRYGNSKKYFYHNDHLGSTTVITDEAGNVVEKTKYYPYGKVRAGGTQSKYLYTGKEKDTETGLYYYGARYYNPELMRWTQPDPIVQDVYDPQSLNRYSYVRNNPVKYTDPEGKYAESALDVASLLVDIHDILQDPGNLWNYGALVADVGCLIVPAVAGGGRAVKFIEHGGDIGKLGKWLARGRIGSFLARYAPDILRGVGYTDEMIDVIRRGGEIVDFTKRGAKTIWLAGGSATKGWKHIVEGKKLGTEASDFLVFGKEYADLGKSQELVMKAVKEGSYTEKWGGAYLMKVTEENWIRVGVNKAGEIITAMPIDADKAKKVLGVV